MWKKIDESNENDFAEGEMTQYAHETRIEKLVLGKIDYYGRGRKRNLAEVYIGFRYLNGNKESYFSVTGEVWNNIHSDAVTLGCGIPETLYKEFFPNDKLLKRIVELADKWHLKSFSYIPNDVREEIVDVLEQVKARSTAS